MAKLKAFFDNEALFFTPTNVGVNKIKFDTPKL